MAQVQYYGTGRRKTSVARVRLVPGDGKVTVNGRPMEEYFGLKTLELIIRQPLVLTEMNDKYDVIVGVKGGGTTGRWEPMTDKSIFKKYSKDTTNKYIRNSELQGE